MNRRISKYRDRRRIRKSGHSNSDRYLITYADLLTLLLGLFVVLYASSVTDLVAFDKYKEAFYEIFDSNGGKPTDGGEGILDNKGKSLIDPLLPEKDKMMAENATAKSLDELEPEINNTLRNYFDEDKLDLRKNADGLVISMNERMLFSKGSADLERTEIEVLDSIAGVLKSISNPIEISGHTDTDAIRTTKHPTNWHLASDRAANTALYLFSKGLNSSNVKVVSYGAERPIANNDNEKNKSLNRRVEITIQEVDLTTPISLDSIIEK